MRRYPQSYCQKPAGSQEELLSCLWRKLLNIQIVSFLSSLFPLDFPASFVCYISIFYILFVRPIKVIPAFFFFFFLHWLLPLPSCTHLCPLLKASISLPMMLLIYSQMSLCSFLLGPLTWSRQTIPDGLKLSNCPVAQAIFPWVVIDVSLLNLKSNC